MKKVKKLVLKREAITSLKKDEMVQLKGQSGVTACTYGERYCYYGCCETVNCCPYDKSYDC